MVSGHYYIGSNLFDKGIAMKSVRQLTGYEKNQLISHGFNPEDETLLLKLGDQPVEYFVGEVKFGDLKFQVDQRVLIPRVETEELVELIEKDILQNEKRPLNLVEVGTGSGAIGLSLAYFLEQQKIPYNLMLIDISEEALAVAKANAKRILSTQKLIGKINFLQGNLLENFSKQPKTKIDYLIANLPYIPSARLEKLATSVKNYEPRLALDGGPDGFNLIRKLVKQAEKFLAGSGKLFLEVDDTHTSELFTEFLDIWEIKHNKDFQGKNRFVVMTLKS